MMLFQCIICIVIITGLKGGNITWKKKYDYVIVGGGTAGCVLANRLSEDPNVSVLLLEAGGDPSSDPFALVPFTWLFMVTEPKFSWPFKSKPQPSTGNREIILPAGKTLGGSSSINAAFLVRGSRYDFERLEELGNKGWGWDDVLPYFKKSESMQDPVLAANGFHGTSGPMETKSAESSNFQFTDIFFDAARELGMVKSDDINGGIQGDIGFAQVAFDSHGRRSSTVEAYLRPVLARWNLDVVTEAFVTKIAIKRNKIARGVYFIKDNKEYFVGVRREVILSAGSLNSPKILMLSGIGPKEHLKELGIKVLADLPVGKTLKDTIQLNRVSRGITNKLLQNAFNFEQLFEYIFTGKGLWSSNVAQLVLFLNSTTQPPEDKFPYMELLWQLSLKNVLFPVVSIVRNGGKVPQQFYDIMKNFKDSLQEFTFTHFHLHHRTSGTVKLKGTDPFDNPDITLNWFEDIRDVQDVIASIRFAQNLIRTDALKSIDAKEIFLNVSECNHLELESDNYWECVIRSRVITAAHYTSTCRMGQDGVVDNKLRVKGIKKLRVVDASIMPDIVSGKTMAATVMIAEKGADLIKGKPLV